MGSQLFTYCLPHCHSPLTFYCSTVETRGFNCSRGLFFVCSKLMTKKIIIFQVKFRKWFNSLLVNSYSRTIRSNSWLVLELILYGVGTIHEAKICSTLGVTKKIISIIIIINPLFPRSDCNFSPLVATHVLGN